MSKCYYHVTFASNLPRIMSEGLRCKRGKGLTTSSKYRNRIYFFKDLDLATEFIVDQSQFGLGRNMAILRVNIPGGTKVFRDKEMLREGMETESYYILGSVPPSSIHIVGSIPKELINTNAYDINYENLPILGEGKLVPSRAEIESAREELEEEGW